MLNRFINQFALAALLATSYASAVENYQLHFEQSLACEMGIDEDEEQEEVA